MGGLKREKRVEGVGCAGHAKIPPGLLRAGRFCRCRSVAVGPAAARPDQAEGLAAFVIEEVGVDRRGEARIVELDREVIAALVRALRPGGADLGAAYKDPVAWRVVAGPAGLRNDADAFGLDAQGDDLALELVAAGFLEGTDGCHLASPWLFEPATIAASMAIVSRRRSTTHPQGRSTAEDGGGETFLAREEWAQPGSPRLRGGKPRGRKSRRRHCGKAIEACRPVARSRHQEAARVARQTAAQGEDMADIGPCKRPGSKGEGTEPLASRKAASATRDQGQRSRPQTPGSVGCG